MTDVGEYEFIRNVRKGLRAGWGVGLGLVKEAEGKRSERGSGEGGRGKENIGGRGGRNVPPAATSSS